MKNKIFLTLSFLLIPLSASFAETSIADLEKLANEMMEETLEEEFMTKEGRENVVERDLDIKERFERLSLDDKYRVLDIKIKKRQLQKGLKTHTEKQKLENQMRQEIFSLAKEDGVFVPDLKEEEIRKYVEKSKNFQLLKEMSQNKSSCPFGTFPGVITKSNPNGSSTYSLSLVSDIVNEVGEWPCDFKLWYSVSKDHVWGTTADARDLLDDFGGTLNKKTSGVFSLIVGYWRTFLNGMTNDLDEIVIW